MDLSVMRLFQHKQILSGLRNAQTPIINKTSPRFAQTELTGVLSCCQRLTMMRFHSVNTTESKYAKL